MEMMKKIFTVLLLFSLIFGLIAGCAQKSESSVGDSSAGSPNYEKYPDSAPMPTAVPDQGYYDNEFQKAIRTGRISIEVDEFENSVDMIRMYIGEDGYIQSSNIYKQPAYYNDEKIMLSRGEIIIRIHKSKFEAFMDNMGTLGVILNENSNLDDISDMYYDTEARYRLLEAEKARLEEYLAETKDPDIFFKTQSRITEVIYEMERLKGNINKWDDRIEFSTIYIDIKEKHPDDEYAVSKPKDFFERIWDNMKNSVEFLGEVVVVLAGLIPVIIILGIFGLIILLAVRLTKKKRK